jgi:hypothetical protein
MMTYAIISPDRAAPWCYFECEHIPTIEDLADHLAELAGFADRDEWAFVNGNPFIGYAPVH